MTEDRNNEQKLIRTVISNKRRMIKAAVLACLLVLILCIAFIPPPYDPLTDDTEYFLELTIYCSNGEPVSDILELRLWLYNTTAAASPWDAIEDGHYYENISMVHSRYMWNAWTNATFTYAEWQHISTYQVDDDGWGWAWSWDVAEMEFQFGPEGHAYYEFDNGFHTVKWELWEPFETDWTTEIEPPSDTDREPSLEAD